MKPPRLTFRPISSGFLGDLFGAEYPEFVRQLEGKSGVYVIRSRNNKRVLYVGESHSGRLRKTLLRHFQAWTGKTAGVTYGRADVEVAVIVTPPGRAVALQDSTICRLKPRDNTQSPGCDLSEDDPF